jgi:uncharacterized membrane protein
MVEMFFELLNSVGFKHPVHPALTHIPMGMAMGAATFRFASFLPKMKFLAKTGYHCAILGLLGILPTVVTGYLDWQHTFGGNLEFLIILKMILAGVLFLLMGAIGFLDKPEDPKVDLRTLLYLLIVFVAIGLGFSGGELQYG